jgi:arginyl-tRNA synthetase
MSATAGRPHSATRSPISSRRKAPRRRASTTTTTPGQQIENLAVSVRARAKEVLGRAAAFPEDGYHGEYIREIAQRYLDEMGHDLSDIEPIRKFAVAELRKEQDRDLRRSASSSIATTSRARCTPTAASSRRCSASSHRARRTSTKGALWLRTTSTATTRTA